MATRTNSKSANTNTDNIIDVEPVELTTEQKLEQARAEHKANKAAKKAAKVETAPVAATPEAGWVKPVLKGLATIAVAVGAGVLAAPLIASASAAAVAFTGWAFMSWIVMIIGWLLSLVAAHFATTLSVMGYGWVANRFAQPTLSVA